jgi:hypothetical protein
MSKFEWVQLETLSAEITHLQSRIGAARGTKNYGLVQLLETDLAAAMERRSRVLADISAGLSNASPAGTRPIGVPAQGRQPEEPQGKQERAGAIEANVSHRLPAINSPETPSAKGDLEVWDKLTAADLEHVKSGVATRRAEMLARHAEELKPLEAEQAEIDAIEKAIAIFTQKFKITSAEIVPLGGERVPVQAG